MLAGIKHHNTTATVLIVGLRDVVLLETKIAILSGEKGQSHGDNVKLIQKLLHPEWG